MASEPLDVAGNEPLQRLQQQLDVGMHLLGTDVELDGGMLASPRLSAADASACYPTRARAARAIVVGTQRERHQLVGPLSATSDATCAGTPSGPPAICVPFQVSWNARSSSVSGCRAVSATLGKRSGRWIARDASLLSR